MTLSTMSTWEDGPQSAAVYMRSPDSLESRPLKAREMMTTKGVAVLIVSWATAGEAMDRVGVGVPRGPKTLEGHMPTNEFCRLLGLRGSHNNKTALFFPSLRYSQP